ncbi:flagellar assembly protein FliW [Thermosediminibacter litoriperuensis]|uniref:Flagellar assembly factor FliW n=1 Tax=Thermosediminibacter litoriperuensis TaxID=291989 RepID=A0A5S5AJC4_9FIRM|nr:flagellar assembly protein FliW [Thermosediminibacter litoriperuensis]TYP50919.1 flagellar assembly factor FliW [Thermosediminibacter litoriperuensis]
MKIKTKFFGEIEVGEEKIINFPSGIIGFEDLKRFVLIDHPGSDVIKWLQSVDDPVISLPVADPTAFYSDYVPQISKDDLETIKVKNIEDAVVLCVITVPADIQKATINLKAPVILNPTRRLADQMIAENPEYRVKHPLPLAQKQEGRCAGC